MEFKFKGKYSFNLMQMIPENDMEKVEIWA